MHKLEITLKQHTPLIHFQHNQEGATLRASEVKPKLDRFILTKLGEGDYSKGLQYANDKGWLIGTKPLENLGKDSYALNYKLKFIITEIPQIIDIKRQNAKGRPIPYPLFFGNLNTDPNNPNEYRRFSFLQNPFKAVFFSFIEGVQSSIEKYLAEFLLLNNFGTRQTKGFGSFYLDSTESNKPYYLVPKSSLSFDVIKDDLLVVLDSIDLFYRSLRSGLNLKRPDWHNLDECGNPEMIDVFYFKSLLFMYGRHKGIQWEKKKIKEEFFINSYKVGKDYLLIGLTEQQKNRRNTANIDLYPLFYTNENTNLLKDLLGLSSNESWKSYGDVITKTEAKDVNGKYVKIEKESELTIARIKSPLIFKIIRETNKFQIYIFIDNNVENAIKSNVLGKTFIISRNKTQEEFPISFPESFSYNDFFDYILKGDNFIIDDHVEVRFQNCNQYRILKDIYLQLKRNYR